jgi:hypothetical protein
MRLKPMIYELRTATHGNSNSQLLISLQQRNVIMVYGAALGRAEHTSDKTAATRAPCERDIEKP